MPIKFAWEETVASLPQDIKKALLSNLWISSLDDHQKARLRYILQKNLENGENVMGIIPMDELERREKAETEYSE